MCSLDFSVPAVIVPSYKCKNCEGHKFRPSAAHEANSVYKNFDYPHQMMYWTWQNASFTVRQEEYFMVLDYDSGQDLNE